MSDEEIRPKGSWLARRVGAPRAGAVPQRETVRAKPGDPLERSRGRLVVVAGGFAALFAAVVVKLTLATVILPVAPKQVAFIKIDAESSELDILAGGKRCLAIHRPFVSIEVGDCPGCPGSKMIVDHLIEMGFLPWEFSAGRFHRHRRREIYEVGNLIFSPTEKDLNSLGDPSAPCIPCQGSAKSAH